MVQLGPLRARALSLIGYLLVVVLLVAVVRPAAGAVAAGLALPAVAGLVVAAVRDRRRRRAAGGVAAWAAERDWAYEEQSSMLLSRWSAPPFDRAGLRKARDVVRLTVDGVAVTSFTFEVVQDMNEGVALADRRHVVTAHVPAHLPVLALTPEADRPGGGPLGTRDIALESAEFNDRWHVQCADARFAHAFCHGRLMARLLADDARGVSVLVEAGDVVVHAPGGTATDALERRARLVADLVRLVPGYLVADHPPPPPRRHRRDRRDD